MNLDEQAIRDLVARWHAAVGRDDVDTVLSLLADDVEFLVSAREAMRGRSLFEARMRRLLLTHKVESSGTVCEVLVRQDLAYCISQVTVKTTLRMNGIAISRSGTALTIFRKTGNGDWLVSRHANLLPPQT